MKIEMKFYLIDFSWKFFNPLNIVEYIVSSIVDNAYTHLSKKYLLPTREKYNSIMVQKEIK